MDALGHFGFIDLPGATPTYFGGLTQSEVVGPAGLNRLSIDKVDPIVTSVVMLDAAGHLNNGHPLAPGHAITRAEIESILSAQGIAPRGIKEGDVVFIHTGHGAAWVSSPSTYYTQGPGLAHDAAVFLALKRIALVGLDNPFTDAAVNQPGAGPFPPPPSWENGDRVLYSELAQHPPGGALAPGHGILFDVRYSGLWDAGQQRTVWSTGLTVAELNEQASELWGQGGRLAQLQPYVIGGQVRYNIIWTFTGIRQLWNIDCDENHFRKTTDENWSWARPQQVTPFVVGGQVRYAVLWNEGQHGQAWHPNTDEAGFRSITGDTWSWARPHQLYAFVVGGQVRYSGLWNAGTMDRCGIWKVSKLKLVAGGSIPLNPIPSGE
jgi:Putative cyclase/Bacterial tandem repeat domain 1